MPHLAYSVGRRALARQQRDARRLQDRPRTTPQVRARGCGTRRERKHLDVDRQVLYPKLVYRRYRDETLVDEHVNPICMRYYYPEEFKALIEDHGFSIIDRWGGYSGQAYGDGGELVVAFR